MSQENEDYRNILQSLLLYFNGKHWVYAMEIAGYLDMDYRTVMKKFDISREGCSIEKLARRMSKW